jgi:hypothetical protein
MRLAKRQRSIIAIEPPVHKWVREVAHVERQPDEDWPRSLLRRLELRQRERRVEPGPPELRELENRPADRRA